MFKAIAKRALKKREDEVWSIYEMFGARKVQRVNWLHARVYRDWDAQTDPLQGYLLLTTEHLVFNYSIEHMTVPLKSVTRTYWTPDLGALLVEFTGEDAQRDKLNFDLNVAGQKGQVAYALKEKFAADLLALLEHGGLQAGAAAAFQVAIDSGSPEVAPEAAYNLGLLRAGQGDTAGAAAAYQLAIDSGHADQAPKAAVNLGILRAEQGDLASAAAVWQLVMDSGHADQAILVAVNLGVLLADLGDLAGADTLWQLVIDSGHADQAPEAALNLGRLREGHGVSAGAVAAGGSVIDSGRADGALKVLLAIYLKQLLKG